MLTALFRPVMLRLRYRTARDSQAHNVASPWRTISLSRGVVELRPWAATVLRQGVYITGSRLATGLSEAVGVD